MVKTMASSFPSCFYLIYFFINSLRCPVDSLIGEFRPGMPDKAMLARLYRCSVVDRPRGSFCNARSCWLWANGPRRQASEELADGICIGVGEADSNSVSQILGFHRVQPGSARRRRAEARRTTPVCDLSKRRGRLPDIRARHPSMRAPSLPFPGGFRRSTA